MSEDQHRIKRLKVATAVAIIKHKPEHLTAKEYTEQLCSEHEHEQLRWKERYEQTRAELLRLRQTETLIQIEGIQNLEETQEKYSHDISLTQRGMFYPTPPSSSEIVHFGMSNAENIHGHHSRVTQTSTKTNQLNKHAMFLQGMVKLNSLSADNNNHSFQENDSSTKRLIKDTAIECLQIIKNAVLFPRHKCSSIAPGVSLQCLQHALVQVAEVYCCQLKYDTEVHKVVIDLITSMVDSALFDGNLQQDISTEDVCMLLSLFLKKSEILKEGIRIILLKIENYTDQLRTICRREEPLNPKIFENIYFILSVFEELLEKCANSSSFVGSPTEQEFFPRLQIQLHNCLLHICEIFPLFALKIWSIADVIPMNNDIAEQNELDDNEEL